MIFGRSWWHFEMLPSQFGWAIFFTGPNPIYPILALTQIRFIFILHKYAHVIRHFIRNLMLIPYWWKIYISFIYFSQYLDNRLTHLFINVYTNDVSYLSSWKICIVYSSLCLLYITWIYVWLRLPIWNTARDLQV